METGKCEKGSTDGNKIVYGHWAMVTGDTQDKRG